MCLFCLGLPPCVSTVSLWLLFACCRYGVFAFAALLVFLRLYSLILFCVCCLDHSLFLRVSVFAAYVHLVGCVCLFCLGLPSCFSALFALTFAFCSFVFAVLFSHCLIMLLGIASACSCLLCCFLFFPFPHARVWLLRVFLLFLLVSMFAV